MKLKYYPDTASLYIDISSKPSVDSREISEGIVLGYDADDSDTTASRFQINIPLAPLF